MFSLMKHQVYILLSVCLLASFALCTTEDPSHDYINPRRLLVTTILDSSNPEIMRDGLTLIRSIRLLGGSLNSASIAVTIVQSNNSWSDQNLVLAELFRLNVEVKFTRKIFKNRPKTMNKFLAFQWDNIRFDYILWLDADIVVFNDPMPHFMKHLHPGEIKCVPDLYSYMRRYPKVNESRSFWNPSLPALRVLEDNELVANGACNTGVLLFDSMSLGRFMEGLSAALSDNVVDQFYENDRFLDSLYFVYVVNSMGIEVTLWPYFMNYMAFFEVEILEDLQEEKIVFAHFLTDTEFFCEFREACRCVYYNKFIPEGSLIVKNIQRLLPSEQCLSMSGIDPSTTRINETEDEKYLQSVQRISTCQLKWPPLHESTVLYRANRDFIPLNIEIVCTICLDDSFVAGDIELSVTANFSFYQRVLDSSNVREKRSVRSTVQTEAIFKVGLAVDNSTDEYHKRRVDSQVHSMANLSHTINLKLPSLHSLIQGPIILDSHIIVQSIEPIESTLERCTIDCVAPRSTETDTTLSVFDRSSIVLIESLLPNSETAYAKNLLLGLKSVSLESQLFLADYLNERMIVGSVGVAMCCDTFMGVRVVERLIGLWSGDALFIWVKQVPNDGTFHLLGQLMDHFRAICDSKDRLCVLFSHQSASERSIAASLSAGSLSFVYVDVFNEYDEFLQNLISWFRHLRKGGLLVGSRLTSLRSQQNYIEGMGNSEYGSGDGPMCVEEAVSRQYFNRSAVIMQGNFKSATPKDDVSGIRRAVDSLSFLFSTVYLATYNEAMWNNRDWLPAWYFHKLMN